MKSIVFLSILLSVYPVFGQVPNTKRGEEPSIESAGRQMNELLKSFKKTTCYKSSDKLDVLFIKWYELPKKNRELKIFSHLEILYTGRNKFPNNNGVIFNQNGTVVGVFENLNVFCYGSEKYVNSSLKWHQEILDYHIREFPDCIIRVNMTPGNLFFAKKDEKIFALILSQNEPLKTLSIEEFVECCWNEYFLQDHLENRH